MYYKVGVFDCLGLFLDPNVLDLPSVAFGDFFSLGMRGMTPENATAFSAILRETP
ncbi:hypothetical protein [Ruegeria sp. HKCCA4008]|uniref:hypothetical protein n=1 Tax=Ruegeria sp. HKCCA4008 TaxID=2682999 RepID=UPI001488AD4B|nr:hypothetical protein [Ruegeria sp. HKCCA4008]